MKTVYFTIGLALLLHGCRAVPSPNDQLWHEYANTTYEYSINIPQRAYIPNKDKTKDQIFFGNIKLGENTQDAINIKIIGDNMASCSSQLVGVSTFAKTDNGDDIQWGKVDFWDDYFNFGEEGLAIQPLCSPPIPFPRKEYFPCGDPPLEKWQENQVPCSVQMRQYEVEHGMYSAYALCSERGDKRVVVCVEQLTDDPQLAEEIFRSFRWTE